MRVTEVGETLIPIYMSPSAEGLQGVIDAWHTQGSRYALTQAPSLLVICISRYTVNMGVAAKDVTPIPLVAQECVEVPVFLAADGLQVQTLSYRLQACIFHIGPCVTSGHYRAGLRVSGEWWLTDDNTLARPGGELGLEWQELMQGSYILCLAKQ